MSGTWMASNVVVMNITTATAKLKNIQHIDHIDLIKQHKAYPYANVMAKEEPKIPTVMMVPAITAVTQVSLESYRTTITHKSS